MNVGLQTHHHDLCQGSSERAKHNDEELPPNVARIVLCCESGIGTQILIMEKTRRNSSLLSFFVSGGEPFLIKLPLSSRNYKMISQERIDQSMFGQTMMRRRVICGGRSDVNRQGGPLHWGSPAKSGLVPNK